MAFQDTFGRPLARSLVQRFACQTCDFIRVGSTYNSTTGDVTETTTTYSGVGAVEATSYGAGAEMGRTAEQSLGGSRQLQAWFFAGDIGDAWPTKSDLIEYDGIRWKVIAIDPELQGDQKFACLITARSA